MNRLWLSVVALLTSCAHVPPADSLLAGTQFIEAKVTVKEKGPALVELRIPRGFLPPGRTELISAFPFLASNFTDRHVSEHVGRERRDFAKERPVGPDLDVFLEYEVGLPVPATMAGEGQLGVSFETPGGKHLSMNTLLPFFAVKRGQPIRRPGALTLVLPEGWRAVSSVPREGERYVSEDWAQLVLATFEIGRLNQVASQLGTQFASTSFDGPTLTRLATLEDRAEPRLTALLGSRQRLRVVTAHQLPNPPTGTLYVAGIHGSHAISVRSEVRPSMSATSQLSLVLIHELVHAHLPPAPNLPKWIVEGVTDYLAALVALELEGLAPERIRGIVVNAWARLGGRRIDAAPPQVRSEIPYAAGTVLGYCLDTRLRRDGSTLATVLARANVRAGGGSIDNSYWEEEIALASASAGAMLLRSKTEPLDPPESCFAEAGLAAVTPPTKDEQSAALRRVPQLLGGAVGTVPFGVEINLDPRVFDRLGLPTQLLPKLPPFENLDVVTAIDGVPVDSFDDAVRVVSRAAGKASLAFKVLRNGEVVELAVPTR